jgi:phosphoketolase
MRSYRPEELFDENGKLIPELKEMAPTGSRRLSANPITNGGLVGKALLLPDFRNYARTNHKNLHLRGYKEHGNINTPLELAMRNQIDRFNLSTDVINRVPKLRVAGAHVKIGGIL